MCVEYIACCIIITAGSQAVSSELWRQGHRSKHWQTGVHPHTTYHLTQGIITYFVMNCNPDFISLYHKMANIEDHKN